MAGIRFGDQILTVSLHVCEGVRASRYRCVRGRVMVSVCEGVSDIDVLM